MHPFSSALVREVGGFLVHRLEELVVVCKMRPFLGTRNQAMQKSEHSGIEQTDGRMEGSKQTDGRKLAKFKSLRAGSVAPNA